MEVKKQERGWCKDRRVDLVRSLTVYGFVVVLFWFARIVFHEAHWLTLVCETVLRAQMQFVVTQLDRANAGGAEVRLPVPTPKGPNPEREKIVFQFIKITVYITHTTHQQTKSSNHPISKILWV